VHEFRTLFLVLKMLWLRISSLFYGCIDYDMNIGGSRIFLGGVLKDEFIRMCTDCISVKSQLLIHS